MSWLSLNFIYNVTFNVEHPCNLCGEFRFSQIWDLKTFFFFVHLRTNSGHVKTAFAGKL